MLIILIFLCVKKFLVKQKEYFENAEQIHQQLQESVSPLEYQLNPQKYEHCKKCRIELGVVGGTNVSHADGNLVDVESDLRNITRASSRCPGRKFNPSCDIGRCKAPGYP